MAWSLEGSYFESCNCDVLCPCGASFFALPADNERCNVTLVFHVDRGDVDGVDVSGLTWAIVADTPGKMADGNWRVGLIMDAAASPEQAEALASVASGSRGGPPAMFGPLVGENLGMEVAPIEFSSEGTRHSVRIGDLVDIEVEDFVAEGESEPITLTNVPHPASTSLAVAQAKRGRVNAFGISVDTTGKNGHSAPFRWAA
ncbi:MAG TPA: DUF1326 domain-containing protein [Gaiellaceae bacterium]|nr:DUF1326 domain-containing protein [Gaiellaceae bacterium]